MTDRCCRNLDTCPLSSPTISHRTDLIAAFGFQAVISRWCSPYQKALRHPKRKSSTDKALRILLPTRGIPRRISGGTMRAGVLGGKGYGKFCANDLNHDPSGRIPSRQELAFYSTGLSHRPSAIHNIFRKGVRYNGARTDDSRRFQSQVARRPINYKLAAKHQVNRKSAGQVQDAGSVSVPRHRHRSDQLPQNARRRSGQE